MAKMLYKQNNRKFEKKALKEAKKKLVEITVYFL